MIALIKHTFMTVAVILAMKTASIATTLCACPALTIKMALVSYVMISLPLTQELANVLQVLLDLTRSDASVVPVNVKLVPETILHMTT